MGAAVVVADTVQERQGQVDLVSEEQVAQALVVPQVLLPRVLTQAVEVEVVVRHSAMVVVDHQV
jgi:hypothetical protein